MLFVHADTAIFGSIFILRQIAGRGIVHVHILKYSKTGSKLGFVGAACGFNYYSTPVPHAFTGSACLYYYLIVAEASRRSL